MVKIEIDDEVWNLYRKSWLLVGIRDHYKQVKILEQQLWAESSEIIEDLQWEFETSGQQEIELKGDRWEKNKNDS